MCPALAACTASTMGACRRVKGPDRNNLVGQVSLDLCIAQERQHMEDNLSARTMELEAKLDTQERKWHAQCDR